MSRACAGESKLLSLAAFERYSGSHSKQTKTSIKLKDSQMALGKAAEVALGGAPLPIQKRCRISGPSPVSKARPLNQAPQLPVPVGLQEDDMGEAMHEVSAFLKVSEELLSRALNAAQRRNGVCHSILPLYIPPAMIVFLFYVMHPKLGGWCQQISQVCQTSS